MVSTTVQHTDKGLMKNILIRFLSFYWKLNVLKRSACRRKISLDHGCDKLKITWHEKILVIFRERFNDIT